MASIGFPTQELASVPDYGVEIGVQYLDRAGWFVQPSYAYQGPREQVANDASGTRDSIGGFGIVNARLGKRWGLRYAVFAEVVNAFNHGYSVLAGNAEQLSRAGNTASGCRYAFETLPANHPDLKGGKLNTYARRR